MSCTIVDSVFDIVNFFVRFHMSILFVGCLALSFRTMMYQHRDPKQMEKWKKDAYNQKIIGLCSL